MKVIKNSIKKRLEVDVDDLHNFQGDLKTMTEKRRAKLEKSIIEEGFAMAVVFWESDGKKWLLDGHQRVDVMKGLRQKGWEIPKIEAYELKARNKKHAKKLLGAFISQYGKINESTLMDYFDDVDFDVHDLELPGIDEDFFDIVLEEEEKDSDKNNEIEKDEEVEKLLSACFREQAILMIKKIELMKEHELGCLQVNIPLAKFNFIKALHYKEKYPRSMSFAFHDHQFYTNGDQYSLMEGLKRIESGEAKAERLRFVTRDDIGIILKNPLPFSGAKMAADFPVELARDLMNEFGGVGSDILDPCHGWGGRLTGFLLSDAKSYYGVDASPLQSKGVHKIRDELGQYVEKESIELINSPFEDVKLENESFDFALTSPPYFDTEKYIGGDQSRERYSNYDIWRDGFYTKLIENVYKALRSDGCFALQVGSQRYPLLRDGESIGKKVGFEVDEIRKTSIVKPNKKFDVENDEVILILRK